MSILFTSVVLNQPGRKELLCWLLGFRQERAGNFVIANGENVASGAGITFTLALRLLGGGEGVLTTGDHVWRQREVCSFLATDVRLVWPANLPAGSSDKGYSDALTPSLPRSVFQRRPLRPTGNIPPAELERE